MTALKEKPKFELIDLTKIIPAYHQTFHAALKIVHYIKETKTEVIVISGVEAPLTTAFLQAAWVKLFGDAKFPVIYWIRPDIEAWLLTLREETRHQTLEKFKEIEWLRTSKPLYLALTDYDEEKTALFCRSFDRLGFKNFSFGFFLASRGSKNLSHPFVVATFDSVAAHHLALLASMLFYVDFDDPEEESFHFIELAKHVSSYFLTTPISTDLVPQSILERRPATTDLSIEAPVEQAPAQLPEILTQKGYKLIQSYTRGGSSSLTYLAENPDGRPVVIKYADWDGISGNGTPWLVRQAEKLKYIEKEFPPEARALYPRVLDFYHEGPVAYYAMEYFEGAIDITKYYFYDPFITEEQICRSIDLFISLMANSHYRHRLKKYPGEFKANVLRRMRYRLGLLPKHEGKVYDRLIRGNPFKVGALRYPDTSYFFEDLMKSRYVAINGRTYPNLPILLDILEKNERRLQKILGPTHYAPFSHGDIPLRNVLKLPDGSVRIIDVRGQNIHETSPSKTSVEYDLAKIAHGFVLELVRNGYYQLGARRKGPIFEFNYHFFNYPGNARYQFMRRRFYSLLAGNTALQKILSTPGSDWLAHVRLGEAANYASDAIHRFSQDPSGEHAILYYLIATEELYEFIKAQGMLPDEIVHDRPKVVKGKPSAIGVEDICEKLAEYLTGTSRFVRFGINGAGNFGKTFFSDKLAKRISAAGRPVVKIFTRPVGTSKRFKRAEQSFISLDFFLRDRPTRNPLIEEVQNGNIPLSKYQSLVWDMNSYEDLLQAMERHAAENAGTTFRYFIPEAYNRKTGLRDLEIRIEIDSGSVAIIEGVGVVDEKLRKYFDSALLVDNYDDEGAVKASIKREQKKPKLNRLSEDYLRNRLEKIDLPHAPYFRHFMNHLHDFYIDNTDHNRPSLYAVSREFDLPSPIESELTEASL